MTYSASTKPWRRAETDPSKTSEPTLIRRPPTSAVFTAKLTAKPATPAAKPEAAPKNGLSFTEKKRLDDLPDQIAKLESEIAKLATLLADADLFTRDPVKFRKATEAMTDRQTALEAAETDWLDLADRA